MFLLFLKRESKTIDSFGQNLYNPSVDQGDRRFVFSERRIDRKMRLSSEKLQAAMTKHGWTAEELVRQLKANGWDVGGTHIVQKWLKGNLQPKTSRIELIERVLGAKVSEDPPARRSFGAII